jgi:hypothetical protein
MWATSVTRKFSTPKSGLRLLGAFLLRPLAVMAQENSPQPDPKDGSNARPPVTAADLQIVKRAREILDSPAKWNRADNRECPSGARTFSLYCAFEMATVAVGGKAEHRGAALQEARFVIDEITVNRNYEHRLMNYNNDSRTTFADIQQVFDIVERLIALRLRTDPSGTARRIPVASAAKPSVTRKDIDIARRARQLIDSPAKWDRNPTQECPPAAKTFSLYCALATAITEFNGAYDDGEAAIREARRLVDQSPNARNYKARLVDFNNDPATTWAEVQQLLELVEERLMKQLAVNPAPK